MPRNHPVQYATGHASTLYTILKFSADILTWLTN